MMLHISCTSDDGSFNLVIDQLLDGSVPAITPEELRDMDVTPGLIDARSRAEFQVSHLDGAHLVNYENFSADQLPELNPEEPVVVYCTVGYRSEKVGEQLKALGYKNVFNLYGGIIQWKNDGFAVVNPKGAPTDSIHSYSKAWGHWLNNGIAVYE